MRISFCYVHGISNIDTPFFDSLVDQTFFFERHEVGYITTTFYPPHYRNSIRISSEDFDFNSEVNYVRFEYLNKWYYYFIDSVTYINENLMEVNITMDYIQTYMFNIEIDSGIVERKHINRYNRIGSSRRINRSYLRENVSKGEFEVREKNIIDGNNMSRYTIINKTTTVSKAPAGSYAPVAASVARLVDSNGNELDVNKYYTYVGDTKVSFVNALVNTADSKIYYGNVTVIGGLAESLELYVCPFCPFYGIDFPTNATFTLSNTYNTSYYNYDDMHGETINYFNSANFPLLVNYDVDAFTDYIDLLNIPTNIDVDYSSKYITQMFDENYFNYEFGSNVASTTFPIHMVDRTQLYSIYWFNISDGTRVYLINDTFSLVDKYTTITIDSNILYLDMFNSRWNDYVANNKNRWASMTMGATSAAMNIIGNASSSVTTYVSKDTGKILSSKIMYPKGSDPYERPSMRRESLKQKTATTMSNTGSVNPSAGVDPINIVMDYLYTDNNLANSPYNKKQSMSLGTSIMDDNVLIWGRISTVRDYEQCARYYHRNGYKVDEYVNNITDDVFHYFNNRYYFNICKFATANVHLHGCIEDEETIDGITSRLLTGIRLWNIAPFYDMLNDRFPIGTYQYDNVEIDYL